MTKYFVNVLSTKLGSLVTNISDLTHTSVNVNRLGTAVTVETYLDKTTHDNYSKIVGYTSWRSHNRRGRGSDTVVCFNKAIYGWPIDAIVPLHLEIMFFGFWINARDSTLLPAMYRPQWEGADPVNSLMENTASF